MMANPAPYTRDYSFSGFQANAPQTPLPGQKVDQELDSLQRSTSATITALADIRRSDGALRNGIVTRESMSSGLETGVTPAVQWETGVQFYVNDTVFFNGAFYRCLQAHVAGVFADDLADDFWLLFADLSPVSDDLLAARDEAVAAATDAETAQTAAEAAQAGAEAAAADVAAAAISMVAVPNRAALAALNMATAKAAVIFDEAGRNGLFFPSAANLATQVGFDPQQGIYVPPTSDPTGASGAWIRQNNTPGEYQPEWFGALRGGADDYAAFYATKRHIEQVHATGTIALHGGYRIDTGLVLDVPLVSIVGKAGCRGASIYSPAANFSLITMSASQCEVRNVSLINSVRSTVQSALIKMLPGAVKCTLDSIDFTGGYHCLWASGYLTDTQVNNCSLSYAIGGAACNLIGCGALTFNRVLFNQGWPVSQPAAGGAQDGGNWAAGAIYATGVFVRTGGFFLQCVSGASATGATAPVLTGKWYFETISDGGHVWKIANNSAASALLIDSDCTYLRFFTCDFTGAYAQGVLTSNNLGTVAPHLISFYTCTVAGTVDSAMVFVAGKTIYCNDNEVQVICGAGALNAAFYVAPGFAGNIDFVNNKARDGVKVGIRLGNATAGRANATGNLLVGTSYGAYVDPGVKDFSFTGRNVFVADGSASPVSIRVETGGSDRYVIENNDLGGSSLVSDAGTGVNKRVQSTAY